MHAVNQRQAACAQRGPSTSVACRHRPRRLGAPPPGATASTMQAQSLPNAVALASQRKLAKLVKSQRQRLEQLLCQAPACAKQLEAVLMELVSLDSILSSSQRRAPAEAASPTAALSDAAADDSEAELMVVAQRMLGLAPAAVDGGGGAASTLLVHGSRGSAFVEVPSLVPAEPCSNTAAVVSACAAGRVLVCLGSKCAARGAGQLQQAAHALAAGAPGIAVVSCKCLGKCGKGPAVRVKAAGQAGVTYARLDAAGLREVMGDHFGEGQEQCLAA